MRALGAKVINTPTELGMEGAIKKTEELLAEIPECILLQVNFKTSANPETYYERLGPELYEALDGEIDIFVAGAGYRRNIYGYCPLFKRTKSTN